MSGRSKCNRFVPYILRWSTPVVWNLLLLPAACLRVRLLYSKEARPATFVSVHAATISLPAFATAQSEAPEGKASEQLLHVSKLWVTGVFSCAVSLQFDYLRHYLHTRRAVSTLTIVPLLFRRRHWKYCTQHYPIVRSTAKLTLVRSHGTTTEPAFQCTAFDQARS